jgi:hypothetical protein
MGPQVGDLARIVEGALGGVSATLSGTAPGWLVCGVGLHLCNQVARGRGWWAVVHAAAGEDSRIRRRDAIMAWIAGAGAAGVLTARVGDALRVLLLTRRAPGAVFPLLAGTLLAEGVGELACGLVLLATALTLGLGPHIVPHAPGLVWAAAAAVAFAAAAITLRRRTRRPASAKLTTRHGAVRARARPAIWPSPWRARGTRILAGLRDGCAPLAAPGAYLRRVTPWQLISRACRLSALACFLAAFHLPATPTAVLLVVLAQGAGQLVPFSPAAAGVSAATLAATFGPVMHTAVASGRVATFLIGTTTLLTIIGTIFTAVITLSSAHRRTLLRSARAPA